MPIQKTISRRKYLPSNTAMLTVVVYVSPETKDSDYVNWEIEYAQKEDNALLVSGLTVKRL